MSDMFFSNPLEFEKKKQLIRSGSFSKLHVVADFDKTLTTAFFNGEKRHSLVELIRKYKYLSPDYSDKAYALFDRFHPIEINESIPLEERKKKMLEWWGTHVKLMGESGMTRKVVEKIVHEQPLNPRKGLDFFIRFLYRKEIPFLILSASVTDLIEGYLKKENLFYPNIHVLSNKYHFDENGKVTGYESRIIHSMNKDETALQGTPYYSIIQSRPNVILLGDSLEDADMVKGLSHETVIKIGFLNEKVEEQKSKYLEKYDAVIPNDSGMEFVNQLLNDLLR